MRGLRSSRFAVVARGVALVCALLVAGCASSRERVDQFGAFAATGTTFTDAIELVLRHSFDATATTSSLVLLQTRDMLSQSDRLTALTQADEDLKARLAILNDLKQHAGVLQSYFDALAALAATKSDSSGMTSVAQGFVTALGKLDPRIANASIGGNTIDSLVAPAANFAFVAHQSHALNDELKRNAPTIDREIRLQEAALEALAAAYASDVEVAAAKEYRDSVALPYAKTGSLPRTWTDSRATLLASTLDTSVVQAAANAASSLRTNFVALVENRLTGARIAALQKDINSILTTIEDGQRAKAAAKAEETTP